LKSAVLTQLAKYYGEEALHPEDYVVKDWNLDPWTRGCPVNHYPPGAMTLCHDVARKPFLNIHFAGTETAVQWYGYMSGAVESGERAAEEVALRLQGKPPKVPTSSPVIRKKRTSFSCTIVSVFMVLIGLLWYFWNSEVSKLSPLK
jgi:hypothetical protein